jgi:hypothetical protein
MRFALGVFVLFILFANHATAETYLAQIKDPDGFTNLRLRPGADAPILGKLTQDKKIFVSTSQLLDNSDWFPATAGDGQFGFIHKSRVNLIRKSNDALILVGRSLAQRVKNGIEEPVGVFFRVNDFKKSEHKLVLNSNGGVELINGHVPFGVDGDAPKTKFQDFSVFFSGNKLKIDPKWYQDCYQAELSTDKISLKVSQNGREILLSLAASGGAGHYTATWIIERNGDISRVVTYP